jgi:type III secretion protein Q
LTLPLRRFSRQQVLAQNRIFRRNVGLPVTLAGRQFSAWFEPGAIELDPVLTLKAELDGRMLWVGIEEALLWSVLGERFPELDLVALEPELQAAVLETAVAEWLTQVEAAARVRITLRGVQEDATEPASAQRIHVRLDGADGGRGAGGYLALDFPALIAVAACLDALPETELDWPDLPVEARIEVGSTRLAASELDRVTVRDLILVEETLLPEQNRIALRLGPMLVFQAELEGRTLTVRGRVRTVMDPADSEDAEGETPIADLDQVGIRLVFELGVLSVPLGELRSITPGHSFDLGREIQSAVSIRANGQLIGTGELIQIDERIGVRVTDLFRRGHG